MSEYEAARKRFLASVLNDSARPVLWFVEAADKEIARVSLDTMAEGMLDVIVTPKDAAVPDDPVARRDERAVRIIDGYQAKDAELARLREALLEIAEHSGRTGEDAFVMADMALDAIRSKQ